MGFLDRVIGVVNTVGKPLDKINDATGPSPYRKGDRVAAEGQTVSGRIVGIERKFDGDTETELFAIAVDGREDAPAGTRIRSPRMRRLRLNMPVLLRVDDRGRAVLDWPAMCARWGIDPDEPAQRPLRSAPGPGVKDTALDSRVKSHLKKWDPDRAVIVGFQRRVLFGMATENWDVELQLSGGGHATASNEIIPFYAAWLASPGAEVPVVVDPKDRTRASVDWPRAANEAADRPGELDDPPPAGSVAEAADR